MPTSARSGRRARVAQKIVSKAEGRFVDVTAVTPSARAEKAGGGNRQGSAFLSRSFLSESKRIARHRENLIIAEHKRGCGDGQCRHRTIPMSRPTRVTTGFLLLPEDPERPRHAGYARSWVALIRRGPIGVTSSATSFGRPWRRGTVGIAIGAAGPANRSSTGAVHPDLFGRALEVTETGVRRRDRRRRVAGDGPGGRGDADRAGARPAVGRTGGRRRGAGAPARA